MGFQASIQVVDTGIVPRAGAEDGRFPAFLPPPHVHDHLEFRRELIRAFAVGLVDDQYVGDLHQAGLHGLDAVA